MHVGINADVHIAICSCYLNFIMYNTHIVSPLLIVTALTTHVMVRIRISQDSYLPTNIPYKDFLRQSKISSNNAGHFIDKLI